MKRLNNWEIKLIEYLAAHSRVEFSYGTYDCALFTAGAVKAMTGEDYAKAWISKYTTLAAGIKALRKKGFEDHVDYAASFLPEIHPAFAHKGDLAVVAGEGEVGKALGIVQGEGVYVLTPAGMAIVNRSNILRAFRV